MDVILSFINWHKNFSFSGPSFSHLEIHRTQYNVFLLLRSELFFVKYFVFYPFPCFDTEEGKSSYLIDSEDWNLVRPVL